MVPAAQDLESLGVLDLRKLLRDTKPDGVSPRFWNYAKRDECISILRDGIIPESAKVGAQAPAGNNGNGNGHDLASIIARSIADYLPPAPAPALDPEAIRSIARSEAEAAVRASGVTRIEVRTNGMPPVDVGRQHETFPRLLKIVATGLPVWLAGPAGSGKTQAAAAVAKALGLGFSYQSCSAQMTVLALMGYMGPTGPIDTPFTRALRDGGMFLLDEIDAGNSNVLASLNGLAALRAGETCCTPVGTFPRHADFRLIAAANTWGGGADRQYVGRAQVDAATINRFVRVAWGYDEGFERALCGNDGWCDTVQRLRKRADALGLRVVISPRASIYGAQLLAAGMADKDVIAMLITDGLKADDAEKLLADEGAK